MMKSNPRQHSFRRGHVLALWVGSICIGSILGSPVVSAQPEPIVQINTTTQGNQGNAAVATQSTGEVFIVWSESGNNGSARRYGADGVPLDATDFDPGLADTGFAFDLDVAMNDQGDVVVVGATADGIVARLFAFDDSVPPSDLITVHASEASYQRQPSVAIDATGSFIVAYKSTFDIPEEVDTIFVRRFGPTGIPLDDRQQVSSIQVVDHPQVAIHPNGSFAIAWQGRIGALEARMRFYSSSGEPTTDPFFVSTGAANVPPTLAYSPTGFLLAGFGFSSGLVGVLFDPSNTMIAGPFPVVDGVQGGSIWAIQAAGLASEEFQLTWHQVFNSTGDSDVYTRRINADGTLQDEPTRVHQSTEGLQWRPDIAAIGNDVVIVFDHPDGDESGVGAACFSSDGCPSLFMDGFEFGSTMAWSDSAP